MSKIIFSIILSGHSSLQKLGNKLPETTDIESRVKKVKRFLDSKYTDYKTYFLPLITPFLRGLASKGELVIAIDGSDVGKGCTALMVSVVWRKRALPICWLVRKCKKGHLPVSAHLEVLSQLLGLVPTGCRVILLGDGEFDSIEQQAFCKLHDWQYVVRTSKDTLIQTGDGEQFQLNRLRVSNSKEALFIGDVYLTAKKYGLVNCWVAYNKKEKTSMYWVTNLEYGPDVITYYKKRFGIETIFGDMKSRGFNIHKTRVEDANRIDKLLIIIGIAFLIVFAFGTFEKQIKPYLGLILRKDRVDSYSTFQIGLRSMQFWIENHLKLFKKFRKNFTKYICVRQ
ncbi:MAG: IS4 family transposase [Bacteroidota bacterium]